MMCWRCVLRQLGVACWLAMALVSPRAAWALAPTASDGTLDVVQGDVRHMVYLAASDPERDPLSYFVQTLPAHGTLEVCESGDGGATGGQGEELTCSLAVIGVSTGTSMLAYTPAAGYLGSDSFTWKASDGGLDSNVATLSITVAANTPPVSASQAVSLVEGTYRAFVALSFTDPDWEQPLVFTLPSAPLHGTIEVAEVGGTWSTVVQGGTWGSRYIYYTPAAGFVGTDTFVWYATDGLATTELATVTITVTANTAPVATNSKLVLLVNVAKTFAAPFVDPDLGQTRTLTVTTPASHGTATVSGTSFVYTPSGGFTGTDSFSWTVSDGAATSNVATCSLLVRAPTNRAGMRVLLVVNELLLPEIATEVARLAGDLESEGYSTQTVAFPSAGTAQGLWDVLKAAYDVPGQFVAGAILIGQLPKAKNTQTNETTDLAFWNMTTLGVTTQRHIWVSRIWALDKYSHELFAGTEVELIKRVLQANHDYRTGASRLPHNAFYYDDVGSSGAASHALEVWPTSSEPLHVSYAFREGGELINETAHGNEGAYDYYGVYPRASVTIRSILENLAQARFVTNSSCSSGQFGGVVNNQLLTRGGGNILSIGATTTTYVGAFEMLSAGSWDVAMRARLASGDSWGAALIDNPYAFDDRFRAVFYGDLSLPAMAAPANVMPSISSFTADAVVGNVPLTVHFDATAADSDGSIAGYEWFPLGHYYGKVSPASSGASITSFSHTYTLPHRYLARVQVHDNYKAAAWATQEIVVGPQPGQPVRVNVGGLSTYTTNPLEQALKCYRPGADYTDTVGQLWLHDQEVVTGTWGAVGGKGDGLKVVTIVGTSDPALFHSYRYTASNAPSFTYKVPVENGGYTLRLGFADQWSTAAGQRLIDVQVEGQSWLTAYDPYAVAGPKTVVTPSLHVTVTDGLLEFTVAPNAASLQPAFLNVFEVLPDGSYNQPPVALAGATPTTGPWPLAVTFDASGSSDTDGSIASYAWELGDGESATGVAPSHVYAEPGVYTATLTVTDDGGAVASDALTIVVTDPSNVSPVAVMSVSATSGMAPMLVVFDGSTSSDSDGSITTYAWDFGDGATATGASVQHIYAHAGSYTAVLTVTDDRAGMHSAQVGITLVAAPNQAPVAVASASPVDGWVPVEVTFDASGSIDSDGVVVDYLWDFGDGTTDVGEIVEHTYTVPGRYAVLLTVTDDDDATAWTTLYIAAGTNDNLPPIAELVASPVRGLAPLSVSFDASLSSDGDGTIEAYAWDFGDSDTDATANPTHEYSAPGVYHVVLRVTDDDGVEGMARTTIVVVDPNDVPPAAHIVATPPGGPAPLSVVFDGSSSTDEDGTVTGFAWDFGDGSGAVGHLQTHVLADPGDYTVTLTVTDDGGAIGTASVVVSVVDASAEVVDDDPTDEEPAEPILEATVRGGCACDGTAGGADSGALWLLLGILGWLVHRRRQRLVPLALALGALFVSACVGSPERSDQTVELLLAPQTTVSEAVRLLSDPARPLEERRMLVGRLSEEGSVRAIDVLQALGDAQAYTRADAVRALARAAGKPQVAAYLRERLTSPDVGVAVAAAESLASRRDASTVESLAQALRANRHRADGHGDTFAGAVVEALGRMGQREAVAPLARELDEVEAAGWDLEYGSAIVAALQRLGAAEGAAPLRIYVERLQQRRPDDLMAGAYYDGKIAEAREVAAELLP